MKKLMVVTVLLGVAGLARIGETLAAQQADAGANGGRMRTYYVAADEVEWDYAPLGIDMMTGQPFEGTSAAYTQPGPNRIGRLYRKALYREYTDETFVTRKPRAPQNDYLGLLGPILRAEVGDTVKVVFKNNASHPYSLTMPDDIFRARHAVGNGNLVEAEGIVAQGLPEDTVQPGAMATLEWMVPELAGPERGGPSSAVWMYRSRVNEAKDVPSGLVGAIIVTRRGEANPDGTPRDVDREIIALYNVFNENLSWYVQQNIDAHISPEDRKTLNTREANFSDPDGHFTFTGTGFAETNYKFSINGYLFGDGPMMTVTQGQRVRWYLLNKGDVGALNFHTPHWHGNTVLSMGTRRDTIFLLPLSAEIADMVADAPGIWLMHCHLDDHMEAGMMARYEVLAAPAASAATPQGR